MIVNDRVLSCASELLLPSQWQPSAAEYSRKSMPKGFALIFICCLSSFGLAVQQCSLEKGGGVCPDGNTCCALKGGGSGCIASDMGAYNATCCTDGLSGCAVNYTCEVNMKCHATKGLTDPLVQVMPRYNLCHPNSTALMTVHGFPVVDDAKLAYYSSHGNILRQRNRHDVEMALIIIHGAGRNADDYFCSATAAVQMQQEYPIESVLVIVPRFASVDDDPITLKEGGVPLLWADKGDGPWSTLR